VTWNVPRLVEYASHVMSLKAGDLLSTGTPDPHRLGDQVTMEVERVGTVGGFVWSYSLKWALVTEAGTIRGRVGVF
jgi:2-keto-4-pentenoate hydratase/2-oxohepta-3-ene-1,7-dioic acid hydratase in catechol pathway